MKIPSYFVVKTIPNRRYVNVVVTPPLLFRWGKPALSNCWFCDSNSSRNAVLYQFVASVRQKIVNSTKNITFIKRETNLKFFLTVELGRVPESQRKRVLDLKI